MFVFLGIYEHGANMAFLFYTHYSIRVPGLFDMHCTEMYIVALGYNG